MNDGVHTQPATDAAAEPVDAVLRGKLAHGDIVLGTIGPIMGHLLAGRSSQLFSDELVARVRAMVDHLAFQILEAFAVAASDPDPREFAAAGTNALANELSADTVLLVHCHSRALEWQLAEKLEQSAGVDPVLTPLLQSLIASNDAETASLAMAVLTSQARFTQQMRRMELPLAELPGDLFHQTLVNWRTSVVGAREPDGTLDQAEASLRAGYDERHSRISLMSRLLMEIGGGADASLAVSNAGVALFLSGISVKTGQDRDITVQSTDERQLARLALALRAAGSKHAEIEMQLLHIHPEIALPENFEHLRIDQAAAILSASDRDSAA